MGALRESIIVVGVIAGGCATAALIAVLYATWTAEPRYAGPYTHAEIAALGATPEERAERFKVNRRALKGAQAEERERSMGESEETSTKARKGQ